MADEDVQREFIAAETGAANAQIARGAEMRAVVERVDTLTRWMAEGYMPDEAAARAQLPPPKGLGLSRWAANRYVGAAVARIARNDHLEPLECKRGRIIKMIHANIRSANANVKTFVTEAGLVEIPAPNHAAINGALALLAEIEGVKGG